MQPSYQDTLFKMLHERNEDAKVEAFRKAVWNAAEGGDRQRILALRKLHEDTDDEIDDRYADETCLKIADAALSNLQHVQKVAFIDSFVEDPNIDDFRKLWANQEARSLLMKRIEEEQP